MCSSATEPRQRLFFALWPDAAVRQSLAKSSRELLGRRVKQVAVENLHITLAFVGPVTASVRDCLMEAAGGIHCASFDLVIDHIGHWPRPRILWVGPTHTPLALWTLVEALSQAFESCGLQWEARPFQAHVTLARKVGKAPPPPVMLNPVVWSVSEFSLMESVTDARGASYRRLVSWKLEGG